jgi:phosphoglycolate phosphatase-like HAD superfamily hydrolase
MERALNTVFGSAGSQEYRYDGKTDRQIVRESMRLAGKSDDEIDAQMKTLLGEYVKNLHVELASPTRRVQIFPGVLELLDALEREPTVTIGLLTGNIAEGAKAKLCAAGIDITRFKVNAFGSDHELRPELPGIAQQRACAFLGAEIAGERLIVIGDTPADVRCGESIGARAIGVATGRYSTEELAEHGAYAVFETLADTDVVMQRIMNA